MLLTTRGGAVLAELAGTATLVMTIVGSGVSATRLTDDGAVQLLVNAFATAATLAVLVAVLAPISGAHLNPVITAVSVWRKDVPAVLGAAYVGAQVTGAALGTLLAHAMYERPVVATFDGGRGGAGELLGEVVATTGLVLVVFLGPPRSAALTVPAWIGAAYFATSSTSFANPAVTIGRGLTDTFAGVAWPDVPWFVLAQVTGGALAALVVGLTTPRETP